MPGPKDFTGRRHGRLTAVRFLYSAGQYGRGRIWLFHCDCGNDVERYAQRVFEKHSRITSCGCRFNENDGYRHTARNTDGKFISPPDTLRRKVYKEGKLVTTTKLPKAR